MVLGPTALFLTWSCKCKRSSKDSPMGFFVHQIFVHTSDRHKITFYHFIGADVCGREVTALLSSLSLVDSQSAELGTICY